MIAAHLMIIVPGILVGLAHCPPASWFERMHELPKRDRALSLCGSEEDLDVAANYLIARGHSVSEQIIWSQQLEDLLRVDGCLETGGISKQLWQPTPLWQRFVEEISR